jgi:hypothetical protein
MNKKIKTIGLSMLMTLTAAAQEVITINDIYQNPSEMIIEQFVVEYPGMNAEQIKNMVNKWALKAFVNTEAVTIGSTTESVVFKPLLKGFYSVNSLNSLEYKITCHTLMEFKDGKMRVTVTEFPSTYATQYGSGSIVRADYFKSKSEYKPTGMYAPYYRMLSQGKELVASYINGIKTIQPVKDNW